MTEAQKKADELNYKFGFYAIPHVKGIIEELKEVGENLPWKVFSNRLDYWEEVLKRI